MPSFDPHVLQKPAAPTTFRSFHDTQAQRQAVFDQVLEGYQNKRVEDDDYRLEFVDLSYRKPKKFTRKDEKDAVMGRRRLYHALQGRLRFVDKRTGQTVTEDRNPRTLAHVPYMNQLGMFVHNGSQYLVANQSRLKPGIYSRRRDSGDLETQFNVLPGTGRGFRVHMDHKTGLFRLNIGQSNIKLYPVLKDMGITDKQLEEHWGPELLEVNRLADDKADKRISTRKVLDKLGRFADKQAHNSEEVRQALSNVFKRMKLDPEVTARTMGRRIENVSPDSIMLATNKLLRLNRGDPDVSEDSRESLPYQSFHSAEDFFREHIDKDAGKLQQAAFNKLKYHKDITKIPNNYFSKQLQSVLLSSGLADPLTQINPSEILDQRHKVLRLGEGGIGSVEAVNRDARNIHPSHFGFIDPIRAPESSKIGLDMRLAHGVVKGSDGRLYQQVVDQKTGGRQMLSVEDFSNNPVAFPGEFTRVDEQGRPPSKIRVMDQGRIKYMPRNKVRYGLSDGSRMFTPGTNFVSNVGGAKGQRILMGARMQAQALPLRKPEAPLVQTEMEDGQSFQRFFSPEMGAVFSSEPGVVSKITDDEIVVRHPDGSKTRNELYNYMPFNQKSMITNTPVVKRGQKVEPGQLLARSNYTDDQGQMAIGINALVGYHMMEGMTHEDAVVMSESAAKKFSSEQMYNTVVERGDDVSKIGKAAYDAKFPNRFDRRQLDQMDDSGVVKVGTVVQPGDPLVLALGERKKQVGGSLMKGAKTKFLDSAQTWEHELPGVVTDVDKTSKGYNVSVVSHTPIREGDKVAGGHGNKGVVAKIVPDDEMPHTEAGEPLDMVLNPAGVNTRVNPAQVIEASLGKVARKTGQPYKLKEFDPRSLAEFAWQELRKNGLKDTETLVDPRTGRALPDVFTGVQYFHKLHHLAEGKRGERSTAGYTMEGLPAKGGKSGAKRLDTLGTFSLLSAGATEVIRDAKMNRGQRNDDYWKLYRLGMRPPEPRESLSYKQFENMLQASGVRLRKKGTKTQILPMTQTDAQELTGDRRITVPETVDFNTMKNVKGGLFDVGLTGGQNGKKWSYIGLSEPMPNPVMETPIKLLLGMGQKQYEEVLAGKRRLFDQTGGRAIKNALSKLDIDREIDVAKDYLRSGRKTDRDKAVKKIGVLTMLKKNDLDPSELVMDRVPVLPPAFRPVAKMEGIQLVSDANYLYRDLMEANENVRLYREQFGSSEDTGLDLYNAFKAVTGLTSPISKETQDRGVRGLLKRVLGSPPKLGQFQRKVLSTGVDLVGRGVLTPDPDLDVDEVGMPVEMAWEQFKPFVIRGLVRDGMKATDAFREWKTRGKRASAKLLEEMKERPVIVNRAPSLHKFNMTAHFAHPVAGDALKLPIPILPGQGADFDGDTASVHVIHGDRAITEAKEKLLPSKMLISPKTWGAQMVPTQGFVTGLYLGTAEASQKLPRSFPDRKSVIQAYKRGEIDINDPVVIEG